VRRTAAEGKILTLLAGCLREEGVLQDLIYPWLTSYRRVFQSSAGALRAGAAGNLNYVQVARTNMD